jgi:iron(III) transport system permease protein
VAIKDYSSLSYSRIARRRLSPLRQALVVAFLSTLLLLSFIPYVGVTLASVGRGWALTPLPVAYTLQYYERVIVETPKFILNSFLYSGLAVVICILVGVPIAWLLGRSTVPGRGALDAVNTLILAVPGTAIGIAYIRAFHFDLPGFDRGLTSFWIVMPLVLAVRRLPYTVRGSFASLLLVHRSLEEAASSVGASGGDPRGQPVLVHDLAAGGLGGAVPRPRGLGVDHQRHLRLLHRGQRQRGRRPGRHPHRRRRHQRRHHQPHGRHPHGRRLRLIWGQVLHYDISAGRDVGAPREEMS